MTQRRRGIACLALAAVLLAATACSDDASSGGYVELLAALPNDEVLHEHFVLMTDYAYLHEAWDVEQPEGDPLTADDDLDYLMALAFDAEGAPRELLPPLDFMGLGADGDRVLQAVRPAFGFGMADVDRWAITQTPHRYVAMTGRFDAERSRAQLAACNECAQPDHIEHRGHAYLAWGDDAPERRSAGMGVERLSRLAIDDGIVLRAQSTAGMHAMLDARDGGGSLRDFAPYRLLAETFDDIGTFDANLTATTQREDVVRSMWEASGGVDGRAPDPVIDPAFDVNALTVLRPYVAIGAGRSLDGEEAVTHIVLAHESEAVAEENSARLEARFAEFLERDLFALMLHDLRVEMYESIEVEVRGAALVASLRGGGGGPFPLWGAPLFLHE